MTEYEMMMLQLEEEEYERELYEQEQLRKQYEFFAALEDYILEEKKPFTIVGHINTDSDCEWPVHFFENKDEFMDTIKNLPADFLVYECDGTKVMEKRIGDYINRGNDDLDR